MSKPAITFIICTYNRAEYLDDSLQSLTECDNPEESVDILVINNNSEDHTEGVIRDHINNKTEAITTRVVNEPRQGLSYARNRGILEARSPLIVFVDDDIRADPGFINAWIRFFRDHPGVSAAGGKIHVQFDDPRPGWLSRYLLPLLGHHDHGDSVKKYRNAHYPFGGNMAFKRNLFDQISGFDTELGRIGKDLKASEEKELFLRLKKNEISIYYVPHAKLYHRVNASRLTIEYIRRQALGLGQSIALQHTSQPSFKFLSQIFIEAGKWVATGGLFLAYLVTLQPAKGVTLFKFRKWIAEGYTSVNPSKSNSHD